MIRAFLDTNVIVYNHAPSEPDKFERAAKLLLGVEGVISTQVLSEVSNVLQRKFHFSWDKVQSVVRELEDLLGIQTITTETILAATSLAEQYHYSYYDSLILASAIESGCQTLYTEDLQHNQLVNGLRVINPFI